ncbi:MAG: D-alanyl-D-alanine carboxypeptidase [Alphaproteobacteria bacterium]|jgi:D-alanyl-D-alanine carboxypeptidase (penicillin-binding protein 5/6)|nr:D-alanyl-D-alanine carboxypeptidase [Alphaproteobacteria bacterium]
MNFFSLIVLGLSILTLTPAVAVKSGVIGQIKKTAPKQESTVELPSQPLRTSPSGKIETLAKQVLLIDFTTGVILYEKDPDERMHPSSMTKIMTAYLVFENLKSGNIQKNTTFPVSERAWRMGGSKMFVPLNAMVKVEDLLKGIIIQSGNDACTVIAEGLAGSEENFARVMTEKAHEMGAVHTNFRNASGWPDPEHLTTARDLAIIAHRIITDFPEFYHMFGMKEYVYNNIRQWNRNPLLFKNVSCDGIKTGHTDSGGYGIVASMVQGDRRLILVANGMPSEQARANEVLKLLTWGMQSFENYTLYKPGEEVDEIPVWLGEENFVEATVPEEIVITLPQFSKSGLKVDIQYDAPIAAPIKKDAPIGTMFITLPSQELPLEVPLVALKSIEKAGFFKKIRDSFLYLIWGKA